MIRRALSSYSVMEFAPSISNIDGDQEMPRHSAGAYLICRSVPDDVALLALLVSIWDTCAVPILGQVCWNIARSIATVILLSAQWTGSSL